MQPTNNPIEIPVQIGILKISDLSFFVNEAYEHTPNSQIKYNAGFSNDLEQEWLEITISVEFINSKKEVYFGSSVSTRFHITNLKSFQKGVGLTFPDNIISTVFSLAITHTRAIAAKNAAGSKFGSVYLPIVNPLTLVKSLFGEGETINIEPSN